MVDTTRRGIYLALQEIESTVFFLQAMPECISNLTREERETVADALAECLSKLKLADTILRSRENDE